MASRNLDELAPDFHAAVSGWLDDCAKVGLDVLITCTYRSPEEQDALYAQGRESLDDVNAKRAAVGLAPISGINNDVVTNCKGGESEHQKRDAVDFVPLDAGKCAWNRSDLFLKAGEIAEGWGLFWAGRWTGSMRESAHIQANEN